MYATMQKNITKMAVGMSSLSVGLTRIFTSTCLTTATMARMNRTSNHRHRRKQSEHSMVLLTSGQTVRLTLPITEITTNQRTAAVHKDNAMNCIKCNKYYSRARYLLGKLTCLE